MKLKFLVLTMCLSLCFCLTACNGDSIDVSEYGYEMYEAGYDEAYGDFEDIIQYKAIKYARNFSEWHPEEAMCIIDAYESGDFYYGSATITEEDYKEAVASLYHYYAYFYSSMYKQDAECGYYDYESK